MKHDMKQILLYETNTLYPSFTTLTPFVSFPNPFVCAWCPFPIGALT